jgi:uncharacterized RDD family membrane protein YckC
MKKPAKPTIRITSRQQLIQRIKHELERRGYPRLQMMLIVSLTGGAGFLASFALLTSGVDSLALRYLLAVGIAYLVFLLLLWLWLRTSRDDFADVSVDVLDLIPDGAANVARRYQGGGGQFGGGGSSGHWEASRSEPLVELPDVSVPDVSSAADAEELAIPLAIILVVAGILLTVLLASLSILYSAPVLFAEIFVDGVLSATLYRRLRRVESQRWWLNSAVRRTIVPFAITAALLAIAGYGLSVYAPEARTLGEAIAHLRVREGG